MKHAKPQHVANRQNFFVNSVIFDYDAASINFCVMGFRAARELSVGTLSKQKNTVIAQHAFEEIWKSQLQKLLIFKIA